MYWCEILKAYTSMVRVEMKMEIKKKKDWGGGEGKREVI